MSFQINPITDIPHEDAKLLGHERIVTNLKTFLEKDNMITPLSIAIHGDWGSGKTSIMRTLSKNLNKQKLEVVFFEAWKYEYANPSFGLISELAEKYSGSGNTVTSILRAAIFVLSNHYLGLDTEKVIGILKRSKNSTELLSKQLHDIIKQKIGNKKLIIIIDDLDRCDVENTLQLLAVMKLFLDFENCICIAAVDFNRLKQAWKNKYKITDKDAEGGEYLDKIFQIRIGIPRPPPEELAEYLKTLINNLPEKVAELFSKTLPKNPRAIKRILNLVAYRQNLLTSNYKEFSAIFWTILEDIVSNNQLISIQDRLKPQGSSLEHLIIRIDDWKQVKDVLGKFVGNDLITQQGGKLASFFSIAHAISGEYKISSDILTNDFQILYSATNEALR